jgi:hypothetical protein
MVKKKVTIMKGIILLDKELHNADWTKQSWNLPPYKSEEFMKQLKLNGMTLENFKKLPVYKWAVRKGLIVNDE